jgi:hypothetical protein
MSRSGPASVFGVALLALAVVGGAFVAWTLRRYPADIPGFLIVFVAPAGLPATIVGATVAVSRLSRPPGGGAFRAWILLGAAVGVVLGALGAPCLLGADHTSRTKDLAEKLAGIMGVGAALRPAGRRRSAPGAGGSLALPEPSDRTCCLSTGTCAMLLLSINRGCT